MRQPAWKRQTEIAEEFGEPLDVVLKEHRAGGNSWREISIALSVPETTIKTWAKELGVYDHNQNKGSAKKMSEISEEFGESFVDVVSGYRNGGCSWETIAGSLEIPLGTLRKLAERLNLSDGRRNVEQERESPINERAIALGYHNIKAMIVHYHSTGKMKKQLAIDLGCSPSSLERHTPENIRGEWTLDPSQKKNNPAGGHRDNPKLGKWSLERYGTSRTDATRPR